MAVPPPDDELSRLQKLIARGLPPVLLVTGPSDFFRASAMDLVLAAIPADAELRTIDAVEERAADSPVEESDEDEDPSAPDADAAGVALPEELQDLRGGGLFAKRSFLCVRRGSNWWKNHCAALAAAAPKFSSGSGLVLEAAKLDKRKKVAATFVKAVADRGTVFEFRDLYDQPFDRSRGPLDGELCRWVVRSGQKAGVPLQPEAAWLVVMQVGLSPAELLAEIGRLRDRIPAERRKKPLAPDDLRGQLTWSFESTPFELAAAVLGGDRRTAQRSVRAMFARGVRGKDGRTTDIAGVLPFATNWLQQTMGNAYEGRLLLDAGVSPRDVPGRCGVRFQQEQFLANLRQNDVRRLQHGLRALHHCQRLSRLTGEEPEVLLERFLSMWFDGTPVPPIEEMDL